MRTFYIIAMAVAMVALSGCAKNWDVIHEGMSRAAVHRELGAPDYHGKYKECWRNQIVSNSSSDRGDYCITFVDGFVEEYGWDSRYNPNDDDDTVIIIR